MAQKSVCGPEGREQEADCEQIVMADDETVEWMAMRYWRCKTLNETLSGDLFVVLLVHILFQYDGLFVQIANRIVVGTEDDVDPVAVQVGQE